MKVGILGFPIPGGSAARSELEQYDMANHARGKGAHAQALDADFIDRFGIVGPVEHAVARFGEIRETGVDFLRVIRGSRDMDPGIGGPSLQALAKQVLPELRG